MIEESGQVVEVQDGYAWVEGERTSACGSCAVRGGCGTGTIAKVLGQRRLRLRVVNSINASVGEQVVIGIPENGVLLGSLAVYLVPLLALFVGALSADALASWLQLEARDPAAIAGALAGLSAGFAWLRGFSRRNGNHPDYQPVVLRRVYSGLSVS